MPVTHAKANSAVQRRDPQREGLEEKEEEEERQMQKMVVEEEEEEEEEERGMETEKERGGCRGGLDRWCGKDQNEKG